MFLIMDFDNAARLRLPVLQSWGLARLLAFWAPACFGLGWALASIGQGRTALAMAAALAALALTIIPWSARALHDLAASAARLAADRAAASQAEAWLRALRGLFWPAARAQNRAASTARRSTAPRPAWAGRRLPTPCLSPRLLAQRPQAPTPCVGGIIII